MTASRHSRAAGWLALVLALVCVYALQPIAVPLVLAVWFTALARPWHERLSRSLPRSAAAGLLTAALILVLVGLLALLYKFLADGALALGEQVTSSKGLRGALEALVTPSDGVSPSAENLEKLAQAHGAEAQTLAKWAGLLGLGTLLFVFFLGLASVALFTEGEALLSWLRAHAPIRAHHFDRLAAAFTETGRGLLVSIGLTCLVQGVLCTLTFLMLGVPRAPVLGFICSLFAVLPLVGTPLVWIPVALGLFFTGATVKGAILLFVGAVVIGAVEFFIGPSFARLGRFKLPSSLILLSMFGGALGLGPPGLFFGPLFFRLAQEAIAIAKEANATGPQSDPDP